MTRSPTLHLLSAYLIAVLTVLLWQPSALAGAPKRIARAADLPQLDFRWEGKPEELASSPEAFARLAIAVREHVDAILTGYDLKDKTTLKNLHTTLAHLDLLEGRDHDVLEHVSAARRLDEKAGEKVLGTTFYAEAIARARQDAGGGSSEFFRHALRNHASHYLNQLPYGEAREAITENRALLDLTSERVIPSWIAGETESDPKANSGRISLALANRLIFDRVLLTLILPVKNEFMQTFQSHTGGHQVGNPGTSRHSDIWRSRSVTLKADEPLTPVVLAIWDSGVDPSLFPGRLYVNRREQPNGRDNDGNGFISDVHGIGFRYDGKRTPALFYPISSEDRTLLVREQATAQGRVDFFSGVDSREARAFKQGIAEGGDGASLDDAGPRIVSHTHGTEVADIAAAGNPAARVLIVRQSFRDDRGETPPQDLSAWRRFALNALSIVGYCKAHGVRVVNMSWMLSPPPMAAAPNGSSPGTTDKQEGMRLARDCFGIIKRGLTLAIQSAPEILFVAAAGNTNQDATFEEGIPSSLELPNLVTVGAVDQSGRPTDFTNFGKTVILYANGKSIEARIPGGERMKVSGTSLAAPQVTNLAAKLFAIDPSLKVADVIELIKDGASLSPDGTISLINPKRSIVLQAFRQDNKR
jgi:hypothetical protein